MKAGSKKKQPENPRFPPYNHKKTDQQNKEEECEENYPVGEEGVETTSTIKPPKTSTTKAPTTTKKPSVLVVNSSNTAVANDATVTDGDEDSSVAEAKPTGLAIAGIGGVASRFVDLQLNFLCSK